MNEICLKTQNENVFFCAFDELTLSVVQLVSNIRRTDQINCKRFICQCTI